MTLSELSASDLCRQALKLRDQADYEAAESRLRFGLEHHPDHLDSFGHPAFRKELMRMSLLRQDWGRAISLVPDRTQGQTEFLHEVLFARAYAQIGALNTAHGWWLQAARKQPDHYEVKLWLTGIGRIAADPRYTSSGKLVTLSGPQPGFIEFPSVNSADIAWYRAFLIDPAQGFLMKNRRSELDPHHWQDLLVVARNSLEIGGRLRIIESAPAGLAIRSLVAQLAGLGFATAPVRFFDDAARYHRLDQSAGTGPWALAPHESPALVVDAVKIADDRPLAPEIVPIYAIGDSHVRFLAGKDEVSGSEAAIATTYRGYCAKFIGLHLGPSLAFNLTRYQTTTRTREKIEQLIDQGELPAGSQLIFSFGEIDCRFHIVRQAERRGQSISQVVGETCANYLQFLDTISARNFRPMVWAPFATTWLDHWGDTDNPIYGSYEQRYQAVKIFNERMKEGCRDRNIPFLSLFERINDQTAMPRREYFCDALHLSQKARGFLYPLVSL